MSIQRLTICRKIYYKNQLNRLYEKKKKTLIFNINDNFKTVLIVYRKSRVIFATTKQRKNSIFSVHRVTPYLVCTTRSPNVRDEWNYGKTT